MERHFRQLITATCLAFSLWLGLKQFLLLYQLSPPYYAVFFLLTVFVIALFVPYWFLRLPLYLLSWLFGVYLYFPYGTSFSLNWLQAYLGSNLLLLNSLLNNRSSYVAGQLALSVIFLAILLITILIFRYQRFFLGYLAIIIYLLTVVVFNNLDLGASVLVIISCYLLTVLATDNQLPLLQKPLFGLVAISVIGSFALIANFYPRNALRDFLISESIPLRNTMNQLGVYSYITNHGQPLISKTGFSEDDTQLGGALIDDNTILFEATQKSEHYWRVESKNLYNGHGWLNTAPDTIIEEQQTLQVSDSSYHQEYQESEEITLTFFHHGDYVPLPYGMSQLEIEDGALGFAFYPETNRVNLTEASGAVTLNATWLAPDYDMNQLRETASELPNTAVDYLQLPDSLPQRVSELAQDIVSEQTSVIDQVLAIEGYLKNPLNFRYSKIDAASPEADQDYVDQFLFESRVGYCDNFSTSMVVLLRSLSIPARWVKGFSAGETTTNAGQSTVTVRNRHAHSWVEVYFSGFGWIPFEPTPNFQNPDRPETAGTTASTEELPQTTPSQTEESSVAVTSSTQIEATETQNTESSSQQNENKSFWENSTSFLLLGSFLFSGLLYFTYRSRFWLELWFYCRFSSEPLLAGYPVLLKQLEMLSPRRPHESLTDYSNKIEAEFSQFDGLWLQLTNAYEEALYAPKKPKQEEFKLRLWQANQRIALAKREKK